MSSPIPYLSPTAFQQQVLAWFDQHGRKDLPWQQGVTPYRVWVSETMLQQTQVATVIPYFCSFMERFPHVDALAQASVDEVLLLWSGLGYYSRARNLHKAAQRIAQTGRFPDTLQELLQLPGIGLSTAGAILSLAFNKSHPILDGNVKRVLCRFKGVSGWPGHAAVNKQLWTLSAEYTPVERVADYTQAMMDLGATLCTRNSPDCAACPVNTHCVARITNRVSAYPEVRPQKVKPVKECIFLILSNEENQILLEKRPPAGIWGGLWSLPEFETIDSAFSWCSAKSIGIASQQLMSKRRHTFSHYHLDYSPLVIHTDTSINNIVREANQTVWYKAGHTSDLGLAAPIKLLLQQAIKFN
ncbi:MAG: A/G-specific adenine glycosylase [Methylosarcina sp.]